jgi:uncharacterized membrane protein YkoI
MNSKSILVIVAAAAVSSLAQADDAKQDLEALSSAKITLTEAIQKAETEGMGKAVDAEIESDGDRQPHYSVEVLSADGKTLTEYQVDAMTGNIAGARKDTFDKVFTRLKPQQIADAKTSLAEAIGSAERQTGGKAVEAETERSGASLRYEIKVAKADGTTQEVMIDGASGKLASK